MIAVAVTVIEWEVRIDQIQIIGSREWIIVIEKFLSPFISSMNLTGVKMGAGQDQGKSAFLFASIGLPRRQCGIY